MIGFLYCLLILIEFILFAITILVHIFGLLRSDKKIWLVIPYINHQHQMWIELLDLI